MEKAYTLSEKILKDVNTYSEKYTSEDGKSIKIEQIRYLQEKIAEKPIMSDKKVYIINNSDSMTTEAQNCLLKTIL